MTGIAIDFSTAERRVIDEATYEAQFIKFAVKDVVNKKTKAKSKKVTFSFLIESENATVLFRDFSLEPQALYYLKRDLIVMGADKADFNTEPGVTVDLEDIMTSLIGVQVLVDVVVNESEDNETGEVRQYNNITAIHAVE